MISLNSTNLTIEQLEEVMVQRDISFAKKGIFVAFFGAALWGAGGTIMAQAYAMPPLITFTNLIVMSIVIGFCQEFTAVITVLIRNIIKGKGKEYLRIIRTRPGKLLFLVGIIGGPLGVSCSMFAIINCGPAYALCIGATSPVISSILAVIFLKEKTNLRFWAGLILCVSGAIITGYIVPDSVMYPNFRLGIALAFVSAFAWGIEGTIGSFGTDTVDSEVGIGIRYCGSSVVFFLLVVVAGGLGLLSDILVLFPSTLLVILIASVIGATGVVNWYKSFNMTGCARAMAINSTYGLWSIIYSIIISAIGLVSYVITANLIIGAIIIVAGITLVIGNPKELMQLRSK